VVASEVENDEVSENRQVRGRLVRIGFIGSGHIGGTLAQLLVTAGHEVVVSNSRGPETLQELVDQLGQKARAATPGEAAEWGEVVVVSVPLGRYREIPPTGLAGKVVIDTNNYYPGRDGQMEELDSDRTTGSELLQHHLTDARVVKAFNGINWEHLRDLGRPKGDPRRVAIPISGDDPGAKRVVADLIDQIGFDAVDAGGLGMGGRKHQVGTKVYGKLLSAAEMRSQLST
jgi:predicted dinucleotide-binding enzyme